MDKILKYNFKKNVRVNDWTSEMAIIASDVGFAKISSGSDVAFVVELYHRVHSHQNCLRSL